MRSQIVCVTGKIVQLILKKVVAGLPSENCGKLPTEVVELCKLVREATEGLDYQKFLSFINSTYPVFGTHGSEDQVIDLVRLANQLRKEKSADCNTL